MPIFACGIHYKTATLNLRERLAFNKTRIEHSLQELRDKYQWAEVIILSTCNRTEIYAVVEDKTELAKWLAHINHVNLDELNEHLYWYESEQVVRHLLEVACGLHSMVLGEAEIFGQVKQAYQLSEQAGLIGDQFNLIFPFVFSHTKYIRQVTAIGQHAVTLAYATFDLSKRIFADLTQIKCLFIGAGETIKLVARYFFEQGVKQMTVASRQLKNAKALADEFAAQSIELAHIPAYLAEADIIVTATASLLPILGKGAVERAIKERRHRPILLVDLAVPRDVEPEVAQLDDAYLFNLDDLQNIIEANLEKRYAAAEQARSLINEAMNELIKQQRIKAVAHHIQRYRQGYEQIAADELQKALQQLAQGADPAQLLASALNNTVNKLLHKPTLALRSWAENQRDEWIDIAHHLLQGKE